MFPRHMPGEHVETCLRVRAAAGFTDAGLRFDDEVGVAHESRGQPVAAKSGRTALPLVANPVPVLERRGSTPSCLGAGYMLRPDRACISVALAETGG